VAADEVLRVVCPVSVRADPDLEQCRLTLDDGAVRRRRERLDPAAGPDQREAERQVDFALPAGSLAVDEAQPFCGDLRLGPAGANPAADVLRGRGGDLVRKPHALDLLAGFL